MDPIEIESKPGEGVAGERRGSEAEPVDERARTPVEAEAAERVTAYFRAVGLGDDNCLQKATRAVLARAHAAQPEQPPAELPQRAIRLAMHMVEEWMNDLASASAQATEGGGDHRLLGIFLRRALHEQPEAFLNQAGMPDTFHAAVELAALPVLPEVRPRRMPRQRLGRLFIFLRPAFWRRLSRGLRTLPHGKPAGYPRGIAHEPQ